MTKRKYLKQEDIKINYWYTDNKQDKIVYLGKAEQQRTDGYWDYPLCHIYLKYSVLKRYISEQQIQTYAVEELLDIAVKHGIRCYCFSVEPRQFIKEQHPQECPALKGNILAGDTIFNFK